VFCVRSIQIAAFADQAAIAIENAQLYEGLQQSRAEVVPRIARAFSIIGVWDALSSDRVCRKAWPPEKVNAYIQEQSGLHFDPEIAELFLAMDFYGAKGEIFLT